MIQSLTIVMDFFPTITEWPVSLPTSELLDGVSLVPCAPRRSIGGAVSVLALPTLWKSGWRTFRHHAASELEIDPLFEDDHSELYDLANDVSEQHDLANQQNERVNSMRRQLAAWQAEVGARQTSDNPAFDAELERTRIENVKTRGISQREEEHWRFLQSDYRPKAGWKGL